MKRLFVLFLLGGSLTSLAANTSADSIPVLLIDTEMQIECTDGINNMYNFQFSRADSQFRWLKKKYSWHPIPYFLLGLSQWWRMMPNVKNKSYDEDFLAYMDSTILLAKNIYKKGSEVEGAFILSASYAFKGRLYAERQSWRKAMIAGKNALHYLDDSRKHEEFGAEILFGDALFNYYSVWIRENYPMLTPIMMFFKAGDKQKGLQQLKEVANNAFFTRTEAQYFLMKILANEEHDHKAALFRAEYLHQTFPNNPYFERFYARTLYTKNKTLLVEQVALSIIKKVTLGYQGYENNTGRHAAFFLGETYRKDFEKEKAKKYYHLSLQYGDKMGAQKQGYYIYSLLQLGKYAMDEGNKLEAKKYFQSAKKYAARSAHTYKMAKDYLNML